MVAITVAVAFHDEGASAVVEFGFVVVVASLWIGAPNHNAAREFTTAVVQQGRGVKVAGRGVGTTVAIEVAQAIVICGARGIVACKFVGASKNLKFVACAVSVVVVDAIAIAIVGKGGVGAGTIVKSGFCIVVARIFICAAKGEARDKVTRSVIHICFWVVVACQFNGAPQNVKGTRPIVQSGLRIEV